MDCKVLDISISKSDNFGFTISGNVDSYLRVENVRKDGAAFDAGLRNGDCIIMINGTQIENRDDIIKSLRKTVNRLNIKVIRKYPCPDEDIPFAIDRTNIISMRRRTIQESGTLHREITHNVGSRISMEISRKYSDCPQTNRIQYFENSASNNGTKDQEFNGKRNNNYSSIKSQKNSSNSLEQMNKSSSYQSIPRTMNKLMPDRKSFHISVKNSPDSNNSNFNAARHDITSVNEDINVPDKPNLNLSLRKKANMTNHYHNQSYSNISSLSKSFQNLPFSIDIECQPKSAFNNTNSMMSLFDDDSSNSMIGEYKIDWKAIYAKVSITIINDIEKELIGYFTNSNIDLRHFPVNSMYRYVTFHGVLEIVFNTILPSDNEVDFHEEILKIPTNTCDIDYDVNSYNIVNLIKCNIRKIGGQVREYVDRKSELNLAKEKLKENLDQYLIKPEDSPKMHRQIDRISKTFSELSNVLTSMIIAMSMWKFSKDFSQLYETMSFQTNVLTTSENMLDEFRHSQRILEKNIINLFRRFNEENSEDVLSIFDKLFSETLDLSICIPLFYDKLKRDNDMLGHLENSSVRELSDSIRQSQYV